MEGKILDRESESESAPDTASLYVIDDDALGDKDLAALFARKLAKRSGFSHLKEAVDFLMAVYKAGTEGLPVHEGTRLLLQLLPNYYDSIVFGHLPDSVRDYVYWNPEDNRYRLYPTVLQNFQQVGQRDIEIRIADIEGDAFGKKRKGLEGPYPAEIMDSVEARIAAVQARYRKVARNATSAARLKARTTGRPNANDQSGRTPTIKPQVEDLIPMIRRLAYRLVKGLPSCVEVDDLIGVGSLMAIEILDAYDDQCAESFKGYAHVRIGGAMRDSLREGDPVPRSTRKAARAIEYERERSEPGTRLEVIAARLGMSVSEVQQVESEVRRTVFSMYDQDGNTTVEFDRCSECPVPGAPMAVAASPAEVLSRLEETRSLIRSLLSISQVHPQDALVLLLRLKEELSMRKIGAILRVTESRVSQLNTRGTEKVRGSLNQAMPSSSGPSAKLRASLETLVAPLVFDKRTANRADFPVPQKGYPTHQISLEHTEAKDPFKNLRNKPLWVLRGTEDHPDFMQIAQNHRLDRDPTRVIVATDFGTPRIKLYVVSFDELSPYVPPDTALSPS